MSQQKPDHHDAEILLRLYDLRREAKLRTARDWFVREFHAESPEDAMKRYPMDSEENAYYRMVGSYWEMAASLLNEGLINEDLFFENTGEFWLVWEKIKHLVPQARALWKNPAAYKNLEQAAKRYEEWMSKRAPEAIGAMRARMQGMAAAAPKR